MKIEVDEDTADRIFRASMLDLYETLKGERCNLNQRRERRHKKRPRIHRIEELNDFEKEDLEYNKDLSAAVITIIKYITAHSKLPKELK